MGCGGNLESLERATSRVLSKTKTEEKAERQQRENRKAQVRRCSSSKRYDVIGQILLVGTAAKSGRLRVVLRINLLYYLSLVWWAILSQRVGPELSVEIFASFACQSFSKVAACAWRLQD